MENNNLIGDASFSANPDAFFHDDQKCVTWKDELEQQLSIYQNLIRDSDEFLQYDIGWNNSMSSLFFD